jgi:hypothetical protein
MTGPRAPEDRTAQNNRGIAYDLELISFALFAGRGDIARETARQRAPALLARLIAADGSQPGETARANGLSYSLFALQLMFRLADLAACVDVDLWPDPAQGAGIRAALDFLIPYFGHEETWPYRQARRGAADIAALRRRFRQILAQAAWIYGEPRYLAALTALGADALGGDRVWWTGPMAFPDPPPPVAERGTL